MQCIESAGPSLSSAWSAELIGVWTQKQLKALCRPSRCQLKQRAAQEAHEAAARRTARPAASPRRHSASSAPARCALQRQCGHCSGVWPISGDGHACGALVPTPAATPTAFLFLAPSRFPLCHSSRGGAKPQPVQPARAYLSWPVHIMRLFLRRRPCVPHQRGM